MNKIKNIAFSCLLGTILIAPAMAAENLDDLSDIQLLSLAQKGNAEAQYKTGDLYYYGDDEIEQDFHQARVWYEKAAQQDYADAAYSLGVMYDQGQGVQPNVKKAFAYYQQAALQGSADGMYNLGYIYENERHPADYHNAFLWYSQAAQLDHREALNNLGVMYFNGYGVAQSFKKAFDYYQKSAYLDNPIAQYNLGTLYRDGKGVARDTQQAIKWFAKAADQGDEDAESALHELKH